MVAATTTTGLGTFLSSYGARHPDEVLHIDTPVDAKFQVTAIVKALEARKRFPVLVFHHVLVDGQRAQFPVVVFLMASRLRMAHALGVPLERVGVAVHERMHHKRSPVRVPRAEAPVKDVVWRGEEADVTRLPALWHHDRDPGRYITAGFLTCYNPETGLENSAMHRGWLSTPREIPVQLGRGSHNFHILQLARREKRDLPVAFWIGHHPLAILGCEIRVPITESHYETAGALLGQPLQVVSSETLGDDFLVPADAEVVIEGYIPWNETRPEGPFGEYTRHVGDGDEHSPFMRVTAITHRRNAYWDDIMVGHSYWISSLKTEGVLFDSLRKQFSNVLDVHCPMSGCGSHHAYVRMRKTREGQGKAVLTASLGAPVNHIKHVFVVDEDIDIFDDKEVLIALATRFQGDRDLVIVADTIGPALDPSGRHGLGTRVGFDCTKKPLTGFPERLHIPEDVVQGLDLEAYVPREALERIPIEPYG